MDVILRSDSFFYTLFLLQVSVIKAMRDAVSDVNIYLKNVEEAKAQPAYPLIRAIAVYLTKIFKVGQKRLRCVMCEVRCV